MEIHILKLKKNIMTRSLSKFLDLVVSAVDGILIEPLKSNNDFIIIKTLYIIILYATYSSFL